MAKTRLSALPKPSKRPQTGAVQTLRKFGRRRAEGAAAHGVQRLAAAGNGFGGVAELLGRAGGWSVACLAWASLGFRPWPSHWDCGWCGSSWTLFPFLVEDC